MTSEEDQTKGKLCWEKMKQGRLIKERQWEETENVEVKIGHNEKKIIKKK